MNTPAHLIMGVVVMAKPHQFPLLCAALFGAGLPDMGMAIMIIWEGGFKGLSESYLFETAYFSDFWMGVNGWLNAIPIYAALYGFTWFCLPDGRIKAAINAFSIAALLHCGFDFFLHHDDGRPHFLPFTNFIFQSPVSYWDPRHHGIWMGRVEFALFLIMIGLLWRRYAFSWQSWRGWLCRFSLLVMLLIELPLTLILPMRLIPA